MKSEELKLKLIGEIKGNFIIPAYQRGYRWDKEVEMLLNDIEAIPDGENYCLQPIVVKKTDDDTFELIDGQQRLTTLYLLLNYIKTYLPRLNVKFNIDYKIRKDSKKFLTEIDFSDIKKNAKNIDEHFINAAARTIANWFEAPNRDANNAAIRMADKLNNKVTVIWYEIDSDEDAVSLFTRLNIGKIPLTNAELVKAIFLSRNNGIDERYQLEISTQWDSIENELHDERLWGFVTNKDSDKFQTKIELLFDLMAEKKDDDRERFRTFFWFDKKIHSEYKDKKIALWKEVVENFQKLKEWYNEHELYHKIGYVIAVGQKTLNELMKESAEMSKTAFRNSLDKLIAESIDFDGKEYPDLKYGSDDTRIYRLLLLFNVESARQNGDKTMRFPFWSHKNQKGGWSLEHIHAQNSEGIKTREQWNEWLDLHVKSLGNIDADKYADLIQEIEGRDREKLSGEMFNTLFGKVIEALKMESDIDYIDLLGNMALLGKFDNSALNNATFDVKRDKIIEMDKQGCYIPICTRRVFLKYYTPSEKNQLHFWGEDDRNAYLKAMNEILKNYLSIIGKEI